LLVILLLLILAGDPYQIFCYEFMHNWCLGVLQLIISGIRAYADRMGKPGNRDHGTHALRVLDERLARMTRCEGFRLPTYRQYFSDPANITANEHMAVQQVRCLSSDVVAPVRCICNVVARAVYDTSCKTKHI
jgi:hypothetical protein